MPGGLLFRSEINKLISGGGVIYPNNATPGTKSNSIKDISVDFTVGAILVPGTPEEKVGGTKSPFTQISLKQGQTAVIRTAEKLSLPKGVSAVCFPPSSDVSLPGLLTTNPGVIDPGFTGPLHLTVINMGKADFPLKSGDRILRVLLFQDVNIPGGANPERADPVTNEVLARLSHDFLDVEQRAQDAANKTIAKAELKFKWAAAIIPVTAAIIAGAVSYYSTFSPLRDKAVSDKTELSNKIEGVKDDLISLKAKMDAANVSVSITSLEQRMKKLESQAGHNGSHE